MNARDELAHLLFVTDNSNASDVEAEWRAAGGQQLIYIYDMAGALIAAGYRKHRIIATVEELDALQGESVVRDLSGMIYELDYIVGEPSKKWWIAPGDDRHRTHKSIDLPATVLYEPDDNLMHAECADIPAPVERPVTVCQACWLVQPCDCEAQP